MVSPEYPVEGDTGSHLKLIGIEEHYLTTGVRDAWEAIGLAVTDPSVAVHSGEVERRLVDLSDERLALMDETGLDVQVLSLTTPALHDLGREGLELARRANDAVAMVVARWPDRFHALAALPVGELSICEFKHEYRGFVARD